MRHLASLLLLLAAASAPHFAGGLSHGPVNNAAAASSVSRRDALSSLVGTASAGVLAAPQNGRAAEAPPEMEVDLAAINAARIRGAPSLPSLGGGGGGGGGTNASNSGANSNSSKKIRPAVVPVADPPPLLPLRGGKGGRSAVQIPRVGYSLYKTAPDQAARGVALALRCGVRHFDVAAAYGTNGDVAPVLQRYLDNGMAGLEKAGYYKDEKAELLDVLDGTAAAAERHAVRTVGLGSSKSVAPPIDGVAGRRGRREQLFVSHKLSNAEQSTDAVAVKRAVKNAIAELGVGYLDLVSIHSPLTDEARRLGTYRALLELRDAGFVRAVGLANYGVGPLREIERMVETQIENLPAINQLELSPFNPHGDVVRYCNDNGIAVGCAAWSKLSGVDGPAEGWAVLSDLAKARGVTKAQLLVRWALQKGYACVPRSGTGSKLERTAIAENSYGGVNPSAATTPFVLTGEDMAVLDGLDVGYKAGKLGRRDGWADADVSGPEWDPTEFS